MNKADQFSNRKGNIDYGQRTRKNNNKQTAETRSAQNEIRSQKKENNINKME